jgi:hypothetical protein
VLSVQCSVHTLPHRIVLAQLVRWYVHEMLFSEILLKMQKGKILRDVLYSLIKGVSTGGGSTLKTGLLMLRW